MLLVVLQGLVGGALSLARTAPVERPLGLELDSGIELAAVGRVVRAAMVVDLQLRARIGIDARMLARCRAFSRFAVETEGGIKTSLALIRPSR